MALGIFVFVLVSLLGLLPVALTSYRTSLDLSTAVAVCDSLAAQISQNGFATVKEDKFYFDEIGRSVSAETSATYVAKVTPTSLTSPSLKQITISVSRKADQLSANTFSYLIFDHGS